MRIAWCWDQGWGPGPCADCRCVRFLAAPPLLCSPSPGPGIAWPHRWARPPAHEPDLPSPYSRLDGSFTPTEAILPQEKTGREKDRTHNVNAKNYTVFKFCCNYYYFHSQSFQLDLFILSKYSTSYEPTSFPCLWEQINGCFTQLTFDDIHWARGHVKVTSSHIPSIHFITVMNPFIFSLRSIESSWDHCCDSIFALNACSQTTVHETNGTPTAQRRT